MPADAVVPVRSVAEAAHRPPRSHAEGLLWQASDDALPMEARSRDAAEPDAEEDP